MSLQTDTNHGSHHPENQEKAGCSGCAECHCDGDRILKEKNLAPLSGPRFVFAAILIFLFPIIMAAIGAALFQSSENAQVAGCVSGLALGMAVAFIAVRLIYRAGREK